MRERPPSRRKIRTVLTDKGRPFADLPRNRSGHTMPMRRLVLMHTPAHAAGEIARLMKAVREDRMPLDDTGIEQPLDPALKRALLESGGAFEALVGAAKQWEATRRE